MGSALVGMGRESIPSQGKLVSVPGRATARQKKAWHIANPLKSFCVARMAHAHVP